MIPAQDRKDRNDPAVARRRVLALSMLLAMGFAASGEAQQPPPALLPGGGTVTDPTVPPSTPPPPPPAGSASNVEIPASLAELKEKGRETMETVVQVSDELRNMAMVAKQEGDLVRAECIASKRLHARVLVNTGWEQLAKIDDALRSGDGLRATYSFMTLDTTRSKAQDLMAEAHACVGAVTEKDQQTEVLVKIPPGDDQSGPPGIPPLTLERPPAISPYK